MPFCNSCGSNIDAAAKVCPRCGNPAPGAVAPTVTGSPSPASPATQSSAAVKVILVVVAALVAVVVIGAITAVVGFHIARRSHVEEKNGKVRVQTPFGTVETSEDSEDAARNLGVDIYPGARAIKGNAANVNAGGMHSTTVQLETDDPADKVASFYRSKFPNANVNTVEGDHYTIVSTGNNELTTISIEPVDGKTRINISSVKGKGVGRSGEE